MKSNKIVIPYPTIFVLLCACLLLPGAAGFAQSLPVIKASSKVVTIRDGVHNKKGYWYIMPEKKPDVYYVELPEKEQEVRFITDKDSISFRVQYGRQYDFIILLNDKDSCYTRINAFYRNQVHYKRLCAPCIGTSDTIPFAIDSDDKIRLNLSVNGSRPLSYQFDLGSMGNIIKKGSVNKVAMNFDDVDILTNSDGTNRVPASRYNTLQLGHLQWDSLRFTEANNLRRQDDGVVGNNLFLGKIVEINYDQQIVVIHDQLPATAATYTRHELFLENGIIPFIRAAVMVKDSTYPAWFMFDTGHFGYCTLSDGFMKKTGLSEFKKGRQGKRITVEVPQVAINGITFDNVTAFVRPPDPNSGSHQQLGIQLLKYFNVILDNRDGFMYLQPNSLMRNRK